MYKIECYGLCHLILKKYTKSLVEFKIVYTFRHLLNLVSLGDSLSISPVGTALKAMHNTYKYSLLLQCSSSPHCMHLFGEAVPQWQPPSFTQQAQLWPSSVSHGHWHPCDDDVHRSTWPKTFMCAIANSIHVDMTFWKHCSHTFTINIDWCPS